MFPDTHRLNNAKKPSRDLTNFQKLNQRWDLVTAVAKSFFEPLKIDHIQRLHSLDSFFKGTWYVGMRSKTDFRTWIWEYSYPYTISNILLLVWNILYFPYIGNNHPFSHHLTNIFQRGWNHQPDMYTLILTWAKCVVMRSHIAWLVGGIALFGGLHV